MTSSARKVIPSPNIWNWPEVYEAENRAQDIDGVLFPALSEIADWTGRTVVDVGCGNGFHLPEFAKTADTVIGVEPHPPLVDAARLRVSALGNVTVVAGNAESIPLDDASASVVHARTAYFFGKGSGPGITEAMRVLEPGGTLLIVDLDATSGPYGEWMRADLPQYDPESVEAFFHAQGFDLRRIDTRWQFPDRTTLRRVLGIEFSSGVAARAVRDTPGLTVDVRYRLHWRRKPAGIESIHRRA